MKKLKSSADSKLNTTKGRTFFLMIFALTTFGAYQLVSGYIGTIFAAVLFSIFVYPLFTKLKEKYELTDKKALGITITVVLFLIIIPLTAVTTMLVSEANRFSKEVSFEISQESLDLTYIVNKVNDLAEMVPGINYEVTETQIVDSVKSVAQPVSEFFIGAIIRVGGSSAAIATNLIIFILLITTITPSIPKLKKLLSSLSPMDDEIDETYIGRAITLVNDMIKGTFLIALVQGSVAGLILWTLGIGYTLTLTVIMIIASAVPVIGTSFVTLPLGVYMILTGNIIGGVALILLQFIVIGNVDNYMRPKLVSDKDTLHPVLLLLGVFGGMSVFGLLGFIYGPVVMILFVTSIEIYQKYYKS